MAEDAGNVFRWDGDCWTIVFDGHTVRLSDSVGLHYLAALLRRPGEAIHATELEGAANGSPVRKAREPRPARSVERSRLAVTKGIKGALRRIAVVHPTLSAHLNVTVRRGRLCRYLPDPRHPITWEE